MNILPFDIAARWDPDMIMQLEGGSVTKIAFFPCSSETSTYRVRIWKGPDAATLLVDQPVPTLTLDTWNVVDIALPVMIDVSTDLWIGVNVDLSGGWPAGCDDGPAIDGYGNKIKCNDVWYNITELNPSLDYSWNLAAYVKTVKNTDDNVILGYNLWRSDDGMATWIQTNNDPIPDTIYLDQGVPAGKHYYFATALFESCESVRSNIDSVNMITGHDLVPQGSFSLYPNPADERVVIKCLSPVTSLDIRNLLGQIVYTRQTIDTESLEIGVADFPGGVYVVSATSKEGIRTLKIVVSH